MGSRTEDDARGPAFVFAVGNPDGFDVARRLPACLPAGRGLDRLNIGLLGLTLRVPDHTTLSRRSATLAVPRLRPIAVGDARRIHLLVDSTGLKLCGAGEWLVEKHGTKSRRAWRKLHLGVDTGTGQIVASALTSKEVDDGVQVGPLLDRSPAR
jgi:Transposase DDE domain